MYQNNEPNSTAGDEGTSCELSALKEPQGVAGVAESAIRTDETPTDPHTQAAPSLFTGQDTAGPSASNSAGSVNPLTGTTGSGVKWSLN